jgi:hypothetical protein
MKIRLILSEIKQAYGQINTKDMFWNVVPYSKQKPINISEVRSASIISVMTSETSVNFYKTTRRDIPQDYLSPSYSPP